MTTLDPKRIDDLRERLRLAYDPFFRGYDRLMSWRVRNILMVSNAYDSFSMSRDTSLDTDIYDTSQALRLKVMPLLTTALSGAEGLRLLERQPFDLVLVSPNLPDMDVGAFAAAAKRIKPDVFLAMLVFDGRWFDQTYLGQEPPNVDWIFAWRGHAALILSITKLAEDRANVDADTKVAAIGTVLVVEDSVERYSALLPLLFTTLIKRMMDFVPEGINEDDRSARTRVRPKVLLARTFAEAEALFDRYESSLLGIISDLRTFHDDRADPGAGPRFLRKAASRAVPILVQSSDPEAPEVARSIGARFLDKRSPALPTELEDFVQSGLGFGPFVFRDAEGTIYRSVSNLWEMEVALGEVPDASLLYHSERNGLSRWFRARGESTLAGLVLPLQVRDFSDVGELRAFLRSAVAIARFEKRRGVIADFRGESFDPSYPFLVLGKGSLGGKGRGLAFMFHALSRDSGELEVPGCRVRIPNTLVIATGRFDAFMRNNRFATSALEGLPDPEILALFRDAAVSGFLRGELRRYLERVTCPLAVRSSSLLEDSHSRPCAGLYSTFMLPNNHPDVDRRVDQLCRAIRLVYASIFLSHARRYRQSTGASTSEEKMAVVIQEVVGKRHGRYYYPTLSGVAQSHNHYPVLDLQPEDGAASIALGLGKQVVEGGDSLRFCPAKPRVLPQFSSVASTLKASQRNFFALDLARDDAGSGDGVEGTLVQMPISQAEADGELAHVGSVVSMDDDRVYDGLGRRGPRVVTFARLLRSPDAPLCVALRRLLAMGRENLGCAHEMEFAANVDDATGDIDFTMLQIRPFVTKRDLGHRPVDVVDPSRVVCRSGRAMGDGYVEGIFDLLYVDPARFDRGTSKEVARAISAVNARLTAERRPYILIGPGRWGTLDPWLGIPVTWYDICTARVIVEVPTRDLLVDPSQGTHFFHNLVSAGVAYFSMPSDPATTSAAGDHVRWDVLAGLPGEEIAPAIRWVRQDRPWVVRIDGIKQEGIIALP